MLSACQYSSQQSYLQQAVLLMKKMACSACPGIILPGPQFGGLSRQELRSLQRPVEPCLKAIS